MDRCVVLALLYLYLSISISLSLSLSLSLITTVMSYNKAPSSRNKMVQQYSLQDVIGKGTSLQRGAGGWKVRPRAVKSNGIGPSPAFDQSPIVMTVNTEADPSIRSKNPRYVVPGNYVADIPNVKDIYNCARGEVAFQVIRENRVQNTSMISGRLFARVESTVTNLDARCHIRIVGIFLNQGMSKGVPGDPNDPLGVVQTGGTHETTNTGQFKIEINDMVYGLAQASSIAEPAASGSLDVDDGVTYHPSHRAQVQVHGHSVRKMLIQTIPFHSSNKQFNLISLREQYRSKADKVLNPARQQAKEIQDASSKVTNNTVTATTINNLIETCRNDLGTTNWGQVLGYYHWVVLDLVSYVYSEMKELEGLLRNTDVIQAAYLQMAKSLTAFYSQSMNMTDGDAERWSTTIRTALPIDITPGAYSKTTYSNYMKNTKGGNHKTYGVYARDQCEKALTKCAAGIDYFMANCRIGRSLSEAATGNSWTAQIMTSCSA
jgi:hypothetical protein